MKRWLALALLCASSVALGDDLERARRIHKEAIGIDSHIDTLQWVIYQDVDLSKRHSEYHVDFPRLREGRPARGWRPCRKGMGSTLRAGRRCGRWSRAGGANRLPPPPG